VDEKYRIGKKWVKYEDWKRYGLYKRLIILDVRQTERNIG